MNIVFWPGLYTPVEERAPDGAVGVGIHGNDVSDAVVAYHRTRVARADEREPPKVSCRLC